MNKNLFHVLIVLSFNVSATAYTFDKTFISDDDVNLSLFNEGGNPPGRYMTTITLNGKEVDKKELNFKNVKGNELETCILHKDLVKYNVKKSSIKNYSDESCFEFDKNDMASMSFDFYSKKLSLYFPDKDINVDDGSYAPKTLWDEGVDAFLLDYQYNVNNTKSKITSINYQNSSLILQPKLSLNGWMLNDMITWNKEYNEKGKWENNYVALQKGLYSIDSRLEIGKLYTPPDVFDSININGAMLSSDDNMIPLSQRNFVPTVTGSATSQSTVEVYQGNNLVAKTLVNAGNFEINKFKYLINGIDLKVVVRGSDGSTQVFYIPYITPAIAVHEGRIKYNISAGKAKLDHIFQSSAIYGLPYGITTLSGFVLSENYKSIAAGLGYMAGRGGAISFTSKVANVNNQIKKQKQKQISFDINYNNIIGNGFTIFLTQRFNGKQGFYSAADVNTVGKYQIVPMKKSISLLLSKAIEGIGVFNINGIVSEDINKGRNQSYGINFNTVVFDNVNLNASFYRNDSEYENYNN
ncbi:fimbria/pilus outer membrane usher protein, partial [Salmonella enterica]|nr:fimbria/pilus outer membrane usher protein [Salmonella enterica]EKG4707504.1 fimbria/pilus outer membrane usher protein [Salmonella enterica]EKK2413007.1 fimbria/pilus outer membrane usher protein [Salmonella enterica]EKK6983412.1 fimbria/pilus outer membrane usher protein [Salmonella enterica]